MNNDGRLPNNEKCDICKSKEKNYMIEQGKTEEKQKKEDILYWKTHEMHSAESVKKPHGTVLRITQLKCCEFHCIVGVVLSQFNKNYSTE